jgi:hypothetical protein
MILRLFQIIALNLILILKILRYNQKLQKILIFIIPVPVDQLNATIFQGADMVDVSNLSDRQTGYITPASRQVQ